MANIARRRPGLLGIRDEMDRLFDDALKIFDEGGENLGWSPAIDLEETENDFVVTADLPGLTKDDVKISIANNSVLISGEVGEEKDVQEKNYYLKERARGRFSRGFTLPTRIDSDKAEAKFKNGVLELRLPKAEESKPKEISIKEE